MLRSLARAVGIGSFLLGLAASCCGAPHATPASTARQPERTTMTPVAIPAPSTTASEPDAGPPTSPPPEPAADAATPPPTETGPTYCGIAEEDICSKPEEEDCPCIQGCDRKCFDCVARCRASCDACVKGCGQNEDCPLSCESAFVECPAKCIEPAGKCTLSCITGSKCP